ncbi:hypothetical protein FBU30_010085 [Linnemannia zychae]|nr:hypothetical protein FBU30_010085 [Linnemannia zychae]
MLKDNSIDEDYQEGVEANAHVYINTFLKMDNPTMDTMVLQKHLDRQWQTIAMGREEFGLEGDNTYLDEVLIKEHELFTGVAARLDLATFCHVVFVPTTDLQRVQRAVKDFAYIFFGKKDSKSRANSKPLQEAYSQLVAVLLALYAQYNRASYKRLEMKDIKKAFQSKLVSESIAPLELDKDAAFRLSRDVANDTKELDALYNDTLKKIIERVSAKEKSLPRPKDKEGVAEIQKKHEDSIAEILKTIPKSKTSDKHNSKPWLIDNKIQGKTTTPSHEIEKLDDIEMEESEDIEMDEPPKIRSTRVLRGNAPQRSRQQQLSPSPHADNMDISDPDDIPQPPAKLLQPSKVTKVGHSASGSSTRQVVASAVQATKENILSESRKRQYVDPNPIESESDEEEEVLIRKKSKISRRSEQKQTRPSPSPSSSSSLHSSSIDTSESESAEDPEPERDASGRRKTRRWTEREVKQLMKLVPKFMYEDSEIKGRKRTIKWAALKAYDRSHGHILRHRSQVMLKDKYRDQTDEGRHRQRVHELNKARIVEREKATKQIAIEAAQGEDNS